MTIKLQVAKKLKFELGGDTFEVSEPTMDAVFKYQERLKEIGENPDESDAGKVMLEFLIGLGCPKDVFSKIAPAGLKQLTEALIPTEKKS